MDVIGIDDFYTVTIEITSDERGNFWGEVEIVTYGGRFIALSLQDELSDFETGLLDNGFNAEETENTTIWDDNDEYPVQWVAYWDYRRD